MRSSDFQLGASWRWWHLRVGLTGGEGEGSGSESLLFLQERQRPRALGFTLSDVSIPHRRI